MTRKQWMAGALALCMLLMMLPAAMAADEASIYPLKTDVVLTYWCSANSAQAGEMQERKNNPGMIWWQEMTGVKLDIIHPPIGEERNAFNIMCASNDMADVIAYDPNNYNGGVERAIADGIPLILNDYMDEYLPAYKATLEAIPTMATNLKSMGGFYASFPCLVLDEYITSWFGWQIRGDLLEEQGLAVPVTMEDWYNTMTAMKKAYGFDAPFIIQINAWAQGEMATAYHTSLGWDINDDGEVEFGPATLKFKEFLAEMNKWYSEGLLHPDFATMDNNTAKALYSSGQCAAILDSVGAMTSFMNSGTAINPNFQTIGTTYPVKEAGDTPYRTYRNLGGVNGATFISGDIAADKLEAALRFLDFGYTKEGRIFMNHGKEGETFNFDETGYPVYTDLIMNNPDGIPARTALDLYTFAAGGPFEQARSYYEQMNSTPWQKGALAAWSQSDITKHAYPPYARTRTQDESERLSMLQTDINTYCDEMRVKFIMGTESLDNFDAYVENLNKIGLTEALELKKEIYADYLAKLGS